MKTILSLRLWVSVLVCLNTLGCFKGLNPTAIRCSQAGKGNCPPGYACSAKGTCESTLGDASSSTSTDAVSSTGGAGGAGGAVADGSVLDVPVVPDCPSGEHSCGGKCVGNKELSSCGNACTACPIPQGGTATCDGTSCGGSCPTGKTLCNGVCIADGTACSGSCPDGTHPCNGLCLSSGDVKGCGPSCVVCQVPVGASQATCDGTQCGFICSTGFHACGSTCQRDDSTTACGPSCTPCPSDPNGTASCLAGSCSITCTSGFHYCEDAQKCVKDSDPANCGTSCSPCPAIAGGTATCTAGACGGTCPGTQKLCNGACIDATEVCGSCPTGTHNCSGVCASDTSANSCGASCTPCPAPEGSASTTCTNGTCGFTCASGRHQCGNACVADDDANACGSTCKKCPTDPNGTALCQNGTCSVRCNSGHHNCDGTCASNSALATCGLTECTTPCQKPTGGSVTCNGTACIQACPSSAPQLCEGECIAQTAACGGKCLGGQKYCATSNTCIATTACCGDGDCTGGKTCNTTTHQCVCSGTTPKECNGVCLASTACCGDGDCTGGKTCNTTTHLCACSGTTPLDCGGTCIANCTGGKTCNTSTQQCACPSSLPKDCSGTCIASTGCCTVTDCGTGYLTCESTSHTCKCKLPSSGNKIVNPGFDSSAAPWVLSGAVFDSTRDYDNCPGSGILEIPGTASPYATPFKQCFTVGANLPYRFGFRYQGSPNCSFDFYDAGCSEKIADGGNFNPDITPIPLWTAATVLTGTTPAGTASVQVSCSMSMYNPGATSIYDQMFFNTSGGGF